MLGAGSVATLADAERAARALADRVRAVVVTAGGAGLAVWATGNGFALPAHRVTVAGMHGAGDAFVGALAARLARGEALREAAGYANAAAALTVTTPAAERAALRADDVLRLLDKEVPQTAD